MIDNKVIELDPNLPSIEKFYRYYIPDKSLIVYQTVNIHDVKIPSYIRYVIFDWATNPVMVDQQIEKIKIAQPFYVISGLFHYHKHPPKDLRIKFFPFWCVWSSQQGYQFSSKTKIYKLSCLNGTPREHRKLTYVYLQSTNYFDQIVFTFGNRPGIHENYDGWSLTAQEKEAFELLPQNVDFIPKDREGIDITIDHPAYLESFCNLVTETTISTDTPMLSEKTFKPIIAGQLFILIASPGSVQFLRDIGLDTFDDIIDHSYDNIIDTRTRIESALAQVDRLMNQDLSNIYDSIRARLLQNSLHFTSSKFCDQFMIKFTNQ